MNSDLSARICDFGMARVLVPEEPDARITGRENGEANGQVAAGWNFKDAAARSSIIYSVN